MEVQDIPHLDSAKFGSEMVAKLIEQTFKRKIAKAHDTNKTKKGIEYIDAVLEYMGIEVHITPEELKRIPENSPFITISNHPFSALDVLFLFKCIFQRNPNYKIAGESSLKLLESLSENLIPITDSTSKSSFLHKNPIIKIAKQHLDDGNPIGIFPVGESESMAKEDMDVTDLIWHETILKFIKQAGVPIIPIHIQSNKNKLEHIMEKIHPILGNSFFRPTFVPRKIKPIYIKIGNPINVAEQQDFEDITQFGRFLRMKTYALGTKLEVRKFFKPIVFQPPKKVEEIVPPTDQAILEAEIDKITPTYELFRTAAFSVICAPSLEMPHILNEIGRLREITFREVGEGTNRSIDLDEYDLYYQQLVIWDTEAKRIVGAYRIGKGKEIMAQYGANGFYIQSLFRIKKEFYPILHESIELGRSFIVKEYQRKPLSLFLLWKGILYFLIKNHEYRYLIGPVSISNEFTKFSKSLIVDFIKSGYYRHDLAQYIKPRNQFKVPKKFNFDKEIFLQNTGKDFKKLDKFIKDIEPKLSVPVLIKKYISLNAKIIGFNTDPKFNDCLDGLIILDIYEVPMDIIESLSKDLNDDTLMERFNFQMK